MEKWNHLCYALGLAHMALKCYQYLLYVFIYSRGHTHTHTHTNVDVCAESIWCKSNYWKVAVRHICKSTKELRFLNYDASCLLRLLLFQLIFVVLDSLESGEDLFLNIS